MAGAREQTEPIRKQALPRRIVVTYLNPGPTEEDMDWLAGIIYRRMKADGFLERAKQQAAEAKEEQADRPGLAGRR